MDNEAAVERGSTARRLISGLADEARAATVAEVRIGLGYTAVELTDGRTGVAYTFRDQAQGGCSVFHALRPLAGRSAADLLPLLESRDEIEAGVGLACANAMANRHDPRHVQGDVLDHLDVGPNDDVAMVGHFGPMVERLSARARSLTIFERVSEPTGLLRPQGEAVSALPRCQIALITATSIINHTIDELLDAARGCRQVALLGASTPLLAEAFTATGVTMLSGVVVTAPAEVLRVVSEGGGMRQFSPHVRKVNTRIEPMKKENEPMKIAVPVTNGVLSMHFGHCERFVLFEVNADAKAILGSRSLTAPPHEPGTYPKWLHEQGATVIIAGGMGSRAQGLFSQNGIQVVVGASGGEPDAIVRSFLDGRLETGANVCDH